MFQEQTLLENCKDTTPPFYSFTSGARHTSRRKILKQASFPFFYPTFCVGSPKNGTPETTDTREEKENEESIKIDLESIIMHVDRRNMKQVDPK